MNQIETSISVPLPPNFEKHDEITQQKIIAYLAHLNSIEKQAYTIGIKHLGTSFNLLKSNGYNDWLKKQPK